MPQKYLKYLGVVTKDSRVIVKEFGPTDQKTGIVVKDMIKKPTKK